MDPEEEKRKAVETAKKVAGEQESGGNDGGDLPITKSELKNEMMSMIQGL